MRLYRNMQSRVTGVQQIKHHLYKDKTLLSKQSFYEWSLGNPVFHSLFDEWEKSTYLRRLTPSVDRVDPTKGYDIENMRWVTFSENSRLGGKRTQQLHETYKKNLKKRWERGHL